jgi:hypothetical protein
VTGLFAGEPLGKRFRVALDRLLLDPELDIRQVRRKVDGVGEEI